MSKNDQTQKRQFELQKKIIDSKRKPIKEKPKLKKENDAAIEPVVTGVIESASEEQKSSFETKKEKKIKKKKNKFKFSEDTFDILNSPEEKFEEDIT